MAPSHTVRSPHWYAIPVRVLLVTFIGTLICFAVSLLLGIICVVVGAVLRHIHPDMRMAYRTVALPLALGAGGIVFVYALIMEIRHYRQARTLAAIEKLS
jgi:hypothetical protein